jgi:hypothetical protein
MEGLFSRLDRDVGCVCRVDGQARIHGDSNSGNGGEGGLATGPGSVANGENGHRGGLATGAGSDANGVAVWH